MLVLLLAPPVAAVLALSVALGAAGIAVLVLVVGWIGLYEWARLHDLPWHHRVAMLAADAIVVADGLPTRVMSKSCRLLPPNALLRPVQNWEL